jgi:hypothetical protein
VGRLFTVCSTHSPYSSISSISSGGMIKTPLRSVLAGAVSSLLTGFTGFSQ